MQLFLKKKNGIYATTCYEWKKKYNEGGESVLLPGYAKREKKDIKKLEKENKRLKKLLAEKELEVEIKTELLKKRWNSGRTISLILYLPPAVFFHEWLKGNIGVTNKKKGNRTKQIFFFKGQRPK